MSKPKTTEQLQTEIEKAELLLEQYKHREQRLLNRRKYLDKKERSKRTHRLCTIGGTIESIVPDIKEFTLVEIMELMENIFEMPEVRQVIQEAIQSSLFVGGETKRS